MLAKQSAFDMHQLFDPFRIVTKVTSLSSRQQSNVVAFLLLCLTMTYDPLESLERLELIVCADCSCRDDSTQRTHRTQNGHTGQRIKFELALTIDPFEAFPTF